MGTKGPNKENYSWIDRWTDGRTEGMEGVRQEKRQQKGMAQRKED
jgi:hypothetical protein